ncbi:MAG: hypothetical protein C4527_02565 [Candidatus Omnitrophota bacterium]|jgi:hypothetical protein|nr:MAG: hypothetical protein C4527_02565 [Candidatus Omnitrophota bacterium]
MMMTNFVKSYSYCLGFCIFFFVGIQISQSENENDSYRIPKATEEELWEMYRNAIIDAETVEPNEIYKNLTAIVDHNDQIEWNRIRGNRFVKVMTVTSWAGYDDLKGKQIKMEKIVSPKGIYNPSRDLWVTVTPEVKNFFREHPIPSDQVAIRLQQLLGLPPKYYDRCVEFWVHPKDLFRPSHDPEITDHEAELDFPELSGFVSISQSYKDWFSSQITASYHPDGFPWTRLGYTYDWGNPDNPVGLSEYVIRAGAVVEVISVTPIEDYCLSGAAVSNFSLH